MKTKKQDKPRYDFVGQFNEGLAFVKLNGKWGVIDKAGNEVVSPKSELLTWY
jgi:hypothetical protein